MHSLWSDGDAEAMVARYGEASVGRDLALRVYTSRLLGGDPRLVLHGGGNISVKTVLPDLLGDPVDVLCVKGSGWDMAQIEPPGLPAVRLAPLGKLRARSALSDEDMVRIQRANLLDPGAPNPSVVIVSEFLTMTGPPVLPAPAPPPPTVDLASSLSDSAPPMAKPPLPPPPPIDCASMPWAKAPAVVIVPPALLSTSTVIARPAAPP